VKCPVLLIHSQDDELIPVSHANALMDKARNNVSFIQTVGSHNAARSRSLLEKIIVFISDLIEEKPFEEEATEDIMPSLIGLGHFSVRNQGLRQDTERKLEVNNYFKMAQKALSKK
jgi:pimeloyl-ACP methyl ester carboxylesterase